jgi:hypothetical protein
MISSQGDDPKVFCFLNLKTISCSLQNYLASEGGGSAECAAIATAKVQIRMARTFAVGVSPLVNCCKADIWLLLPEHRGEQTARNGADILDVVLVVMLAVVLMVMLSLSLVLALVIFGFQKET